MARFINAPSVTNHSVVMQNSQSEYSEGRGWQILFGGFDMGYGTDFVRHPVEASAKVNGFFIPPC
jgi:hypothetical protein